MNIERLRQTLEQLNPLFWSAKIDDKLRKKGFKNNGCFGSASLLARFFLALGNSTPEQRSKYPTSAGYRQGKRLDKLLTKLQDCLAPRDATDKKEADETFEVLRKRFQSRFAEDVLLTYKDVARYFSTPSLKQCRDWWRLVVCMSHEDFWAADIASEQKKDEDDGAYIPYTKAIELSNGILTRKKLDKAIDQSKPIRVRSKKPRRNRRSVHIQDVLCLINKLSENDRAGEEAARMFGEYQKLHQKKMGEQINLD